MNRFNSGEFQSAFQVLQNGTTLVLGANFFCKIESMVILINNHVLNINDSNNQTVHRTFIVDLKF